MHTTSRRQAILFFDRKMRGGGPPVRYFGLGTTGQRGGQLNRMGWLLVVTQGVTQDVSLVVLVSKIALVS
jgi:hypothetical protein